MLLLSSHVVMNTFYLVIRHFDVKHLGTLQSVTTSNLLYSCPALREEREAMKKELHATLEEERAAQRDRLEAQRRRETERLKAELEEELRLERRRLEGEREEKLKSMKQEVTDRLLFTSSCLFFC